MVRVYSLRRGRTALGPHRNGYDPRRSDEGARRAFHFPEVRFVAGTVYGSPPGSAMQSTPTSCSSSLVFRPELTASCRGLPSRAEGVGCDGSGGAASRGARDGTGRVGVCQKVEKLGGGEDRLGFPT